MRQLSFHVMSFLVYNRFGFGSVVPWSGDCDTGLWNGRMIGMVGGLMRVCK